MTAKEWRESNPELAQNGNIRDYTDFVKLITILEIEMLKEYLKLL